MDTDLTDKYGLKPKFKTLSLTELAGGAEKSYDFCSAALLGPKIKNLIGH